MISFYGLYGLGGPDPATLRLQQLILRRSTLAQLLDCYLACDCSAVRLRYQILFDKILYDLDRAIDFYALGSDSNGRGEPEARAATFGLIGFELMKRAEQKNLDPLKLTTPSGDLRVEEVRAETGYPLAERQQEETRVNGILSQLVALAQVVTTNADPAHASVVGEINLIVNDLLAGIGVRAG